MIYSRASEMIGNTPLFALPPLGGAQGARILAKLEYCNPGGSIKDRPALAMIQAAEQSGELRAGMTIVEATAGNTGIGLALVARDRGYGCVLFVPDKVCEEKRAMLKALDVKVILTPKEEGMGEAISRAGAYCADSGNCFMPCQFDNPANPEQAEHILAAEISAQLDGIPDALAIGAGSGGTFTGLARWLKRENPNAVCHLVQPQGSVFDGSPYQPSQIDGIGNSFLPRILDTELADEMVTVSCEDAFWACRLLAREKALLVGSSSGANFFAARRLARRLAPGDRVLTVFPDHMERYFSQSWTDQLHQTSLDSCTT